MTHYFIHYAVFHPRDYKGGNVRGVILSEIMRKGSTRHGDYDPTGLSQSAVLAHENDMEGALVVVENASGLFGSTRVSHVETLAHNQFRQSAVERRLFGRRGDDAIRVDDDHPVLFIEPKGHGIEAFHGGTNWPMLKASSSIGIRVRQRDRTVPALPVPVRAPGATLFRSPRPCGPLRGTETVICTPECLTTERGRCRYAQMGTSCASTRRQLVRSVQRSAGQLVAATWHGRRGVGMTQDEQGDEGRRQGEWFLTPAETIKRHFDLGDAFSTTYVHHPVLGVTRAPTR